MGDLPDDLPRLIHETLETLGWDADATAIAEGVKRLDFGLPAENEFSVICSWLGKCEVLHKLDQHQIPKESSKKFQVPDILARFSTQTNEHPVLIEVKTKTDNTLSFKPDYLLRLQCYADLVGMPLLIAWKHHSLWMLFEAKHLKKAERNFNISYFNALKENLLGVLAGDVAYQIGDGAGIHLCIQKDELLSVEEEGQDKHENWESRITEVVFTGRDGEVVSNLSPDVNLLFATWDLERQEDHLENHIWVRHLVVGDEIQFAHKALVRLLDWQQPEGARLSWRRVARKEKLNTISDFRKAVTRALDEKVVQYVFDQAPRTMPDFLK